MSRVLEHAHTLARLWRHPRVSRDEITNFRVRKLQSVLAHAFAAVPYYREAFRRAGARPEDVRSVADLAAPAALENELLFRSRPDTSLYSRQHQAFVELLRNQVERIVHLGEVVGDDECFRHASVNPNQVFTRDSLITIPWLPDGYIAARMAEPLRRPEARITALAATRLGLAEILRLPEDVFLEGGDVVPFERAGRRTLLVGYGPRTGLDAVRFLGTAMVPDLADEVVGIELARWRMNLDGGFLPLTDDVVVSNRSSLLGATMFDGGAPRPFEVFAMIRELEMKLVDVDEHDSVHAQACNFVCLGGRKVIGYDLAPQVVARLRECNVEVLVTPGSELVKGRGGPRCMSRPIYRRIAR